MIPLLGGQVVRPAHRWLLRQRPSQLLAHIRSVTDPDGFAALKDQYTATGHAGSNDCNNALNRVTWIVASKGGTVHDVTIGDCVELQHAIGEHQTNGYHGKHLFYALLAGLGVFGPDAPARLKTVMLPGQLTPAALVDRQGITCTAMRDLLVDYRLSPLQYDHVNFLGRYAFIRPAAPGPRKLRDPHTDEDDDNCGQK